MNRVDEMIKEFEKVARKTGFNPAKFDPLKLDPLMMKAFLSGNAGFGGGGRQFKGKSLAIINKANEFISQYNMPLTVRQIYYRFVGEQLIENSLKSYKNLANILARAREEGLIEFASVVDRTRQATKPSSWDSSKDFFDTVKKSYRRNLLIDQDRYVEVWVEKDALAGVLEPITSRYDIHLVVGRGYPSLSALYDASCRLPTDKTVTLLYFGDFDPSGEDISRDIPERLSRIFGLEVDFEKVALTSEDIQNFNLPPAPAKKSDSRAGAFIARHGDIAVELDALPPDVLVARIKENIERNLDMAAFHKQQEKEREDKKQIEQLLKNLA